MCYCNCRDIDFYHFRYKTDKFNLQGAQTLPQTGAGALNDSPGTEFDNPINVTAPSQVK